MRTNVAIYIAIAIANVALNGLGLLHLLDVMDIPAGFVTAALLFNLCVLPVVLYGAYRSGGIVEEISIQRATTAHLAAAATEARQTLKQKESRENDIEGKRKSN